jgi:lysyl-tRNA synthetase class 2
MSSEDTLIQVRKQKHQQLNGGKYPLSTSYEEFPGYCWPLGHFSKHIDWMAEHPRSDPESTEDERILTTIDLKELSNIVKCKIRGRISALRKSGAITFIKVTDQTGSLQVIVSKAAYPSYDDMKLLDLGDIVEFKGHPCRSKTGENSVLAFDLKMLAKSHRPPPEKFIGLADQEIKTRQRYLDLMSSEETRARFIVRARIMKAIRSFMDKRDFLEVETPTLTSVASGANAKPFTTHHNELEQDMFLRIAPELYLKRLLVGGYPRVYELGRNYRNEGMSTRHNPEFTMMEFYEAYGHFQDLIDYTVDLLGHVQWELNSFLPDHVTNHYQKWEAERTFSLDKSDFVQIPMWDATLHALSKAEVLVGSHIMPRLLHTEQVSLDLEITNVKNERLLRIDMKGMFHALSNCISNGEKLMVLFEYVAEPFLTEDYRTDDGKLSKPVFITEYPKDVCPLARANDKNPLVCDRFELFVDGRELANAFQELNDPDEQARRFQEQLEGNEKDPMAYDADYIQALEYGMPPAIGFGMGIDRLVMLMTNASTIKDVILFPTLRTEK